MAVIEVTKMWSKNDGGVSSSDGKTFKFTEAESYQVVVEPNTTKLEILSHEDIPKVGQFVLGAPFITVKDVQCKQMTPIFWIVDTKLSGEVGSNDPKSSPIDNTPVIRRRSVESEAEIDIDYDGNVIATNNNEPIYGVKKKIYDLEISVTRNFLFVNDQIALQYLDSVNSDVFFGFAPGQVKMTSYSYEDVFAQIRYFKVTGTFLARTPYNTTAQKAWYARLRHEGFYEKVGSDIIHAVDKNNDKVNKPVLLKEDGTRETDSANAFFKEFKRYGTLPYNALGFV